MKKKSLLTDVRFPGNIIMEERDVNGVKKWFLRGEFGVVDTPTENKRIYGKKIMEREIKKLESLIQEGCLYGELDHPDDGKTKLDRVSHLITDLHIEGNQIVGEALILDTARGQNLKAILAAGGKVGSSSRGYGNVIIDSKGYETVQPDYQLVAFDIVASPSANTYPELFIEHKEGEMNLNDINNISLDDFKSQFPDLYAKIVEGEKVKNIQQQEIDEQFKKKHQEIDALLADKDRQIEELKRVTKELGFRLFIEQNYAGHPDFKKILEMIGDVSVYKSTDEIKQKIEAIISILNKGRAGEFRANNVIESKLKQVGFMANRLRRKAEELLMNDNTSSTDEVKRIIDEVKRIDEIKHKYKSENAKLQEALQKSLSIAKELGLQLYAERKMRFHPRAEEARRIFQKDGFISKDNIDKVLFSLKQEGRGEISVQRKGISLTEDGLSRTDEKLLFVEDDFGLNLNDMKRLAGLQGNDIRYIDMKGSSNIQVQNDKKSEIDRQIMGL